LRIGRIVVIGALYVDDDALWFCGFGGLGVLGLAMHDALTVEEELGDVGHGDGVSAGNAVVGDLLEEIAEEEVYGGRGLQVGDALEELLGYRGTVFGRAKSLLGVGCVAVADVLGVLTLGMVGAESGVAGGEWFEAAAAGFGVVLAAGVGCGHGVILCGFGWGVGR
jgi:hypothetical protein